MPVINHVHKNKALILLIAFIVSIALPFPAVNFAEELKYTANSFADVQHLTVCFEPINEPNTVDHEATSPGLHNNENPAPLAGSFETPQYNWSEEYSKVKFGDRPPIYLKDVPCDAFEEGRIYIKIKPGISEKLRKGIRNKSNSGFIQTGIAELDLLNEKYQVKNYKPLFEGVYNISDVSKQNIDRHQAWGLHLWYELEINTKYDIKTIVKEYGSLKEIAIAEPAYKKVLISDIETFELSPFWVPGDPLFEYQWHYHNTGQQDGTPGADIDLIRAWDIEKGNPHVIVAVIDSGIQYNHPDLAANMWPDTGFNFVDETTTILPGSHGTHVAGTVAAVSNNSKGVAGIAGGSGSGDGVRLMSCQVFSNSNNGGFHLAPVWAADNGAAISQNSWGYSTPGVYEAHILDAIDYFNANGGGNVLDGGLTIFSAGNSDDNGAWYPAFYSGAMAVAATNNQDKKADYSNYGDWVEISAPGGDTSSVSERGVLSTTTGYWYEYKQGTSMACPHVSGVAALMISLAPGEFTASEVRDILKETADDHYAENPEYLGELGAGRLNAYQALLRIQVEIGMLDADLSSLVVSKGSLEPVFHPATTNYTLYVTHDVDSIDVTATLFDSEANMTIEGEPATNEEPKTVILGAPGTATVIEIVVTAEESTAIKTYTITVNRLDPAQTFIDVPLNHTFYLDIEAVYAAGIAGGYGDGTYGPGDYFTRGQMAAFLNRALGLAPGDGQSFTDVPTDHTFYLDIEAIYAAGIAGGYGDGNYGPGDNVTRGQMAAFLNRALGLAPGEGPSFDDVSLDHTFYLDIEAIYAAGIAGGYGDGNYGPGDNVTRGQMAAFLARALGLHN